MDLLAEHEDCAVVPGEFSLFCFGQFFQEVFAPVSDGVFPEQALDYHTGIMRDFDRPDLYPFRAVARKICREIGWHPALFFNPRTDAVKILGGSYQQARHTLDQALNEVTASHGRSGVSALSGAIADVLEHAGKGATAKGGGQAPRYAVFDQLVSPPYFKDAVAAVPAMKFINVDRDWRDQYVSMRPLAKAMLERNRALGIRPWDEDDNPADGDIVEVFLKFRRKVEKHLATLRKEAPDNTLLVQYEDLVLNSDGESKRIFDFLGLTLQGWSPRTVFFNEKSRQRIGKWQRQPWCDEDLTRDIDRLKEHLPLPNYSSV